MKTQKVEVSSQTSISAVEYSCFPLVSIIINNYNYGHFVAQAVDSALNQTYENIEVIVVDDGSTDNSLSMISTYGERIISISKENAGQASAMNAGFVASSGKIICLLDADDLFLPERISRVVELFQTDPQVEWVFTESATVETAEISTANLELLFEKARVASTSGKLEKIDFRQNIRIGTIPDFTPSTSNICLSRNLSKKLFPLPEIKGISGVAISDLYIKTTAVGLGIGWVTTENLGVYRLHENYYKTLNLDKKRRMFGEINTMTGYWMEENFSGFGKIGKKFLTKGFATYLSSHYSKQESADADCAQTLTSYLNKCSPLEKIETYLFISYYRLRLIFKDFV